MEVSNKYSFQKDLRKEVKKSNIKKNQILMLHVRLKTIKKFYNVSYENLSDIIIKELLNTKPKNIIVPSFTYSFGFNKKFDLNESPSETGYFSEIFRQKYNRYRTNDPFYSICHYKTNKSLYKKKNITFKESFSKNTVWEYLFNQNITNID